MRFKINKRCPRCNTKVPVEILTCPNCQLKYSKFEMATNKEAKEAYRNGESDQVLMRKGCPADVKLWKLLLIAILLGFTGAHHYYVGRIKAGIFYTIFFVVGVANAVITSILKVTPTGELWEIFGFLVLIWGAVLVLWIIDVAKICLNKYKVPVSINK